VTAPWISLRIWAGLSAALATTLTLAPSASADEPTLSEAKYNPTQKPPEGTGTTTFLVGAALTVGWYGEAVGVSYAWKKAPNARDLRLPLIGPWLSLRNVRCGADEHPCNTGTLILRTALGVIGGVGQLGGVIGMLEGAFADTGASTPSGSGPAEPEPKRSPAGRSVALSLPAPVMLPGGAGVELWGRF
jgi:hypothetical protein